MTHLEPAQIYYKIVSIAKVFVENRKWLTIDSVSNLDPSIEELADIAKQISEIISAISNDYSDENMAINAKQCSVELLQLAKAVKENNEVAMQNALDAMKKYTNGPY